MTPDTQLGNPHSLSDWLGRLGQFPGDGWLVIRGDTEVIQGDLLCWPQVFSARDLSDDEYDQMEEWIGQNGYGMFLGEDQLEDIAENLRQQVPAYSPDQLVQAVDYYWRNDAFIDIGQQDESS
jgi:hypothetical protein